MDNRFEHKVALVTGAGSGIGRATAQAFAAEGAKVIVADRNIEGAKGTVALIAKANGESSAIEVDISNSDSVQTMVNFCIEQYGQLDCAANNAGILGSMAPLTADYDEAIFNQVINVNVIGTWLCMKYELPHLIKSGGNIVNTASIAGLVGFPALSAYSASKHAVVGMTKTAALEYAKQGVRINAVCPGGTRTPMAGYGAGHDEEADKSAAAYSPMGRVAEPEEMADAILFLCSNQSSYVTGHPLVVDSGMVAQ